MGLFPFLFLRKENDVYTLSIPAFGNDMVPEPLITYYTQEIDITFTQYYQFFCLCKNY